MVEILGFFIVFGLLAALVGTLATGAIRMIGFGILVALALIIGMPVIQGSSSSFFGGPAANQVAPQDTQQRPTGQVPASVGGPLSPSAGAGAGDNVIQGSSIPEGSGSTSGSGQSRGVRAMW